MGSEPIVRTDERTDLSYSWQVYYELNIGAVPVCDGDRLVGMVTDRDIVVRGVAQELNLRECKLSDVMSAHVRTVREDDEVHEVLREMGQSQVRRLPVVDRNDRLVGIVSIGDIAAKQALSEPEAHQQVGQSLGDISEPAEPDRSHQSQASGLQGGGGNKSQRQPG
jgi:predicted transcriptional regulator